MRKFILLPIVFIAVLVMAVVVPLLNMKGDTPGSSSSFSSCDGNETVNVGDKQYTDEMLKNAGMIIDAGEPLNAPDKAEIIALSTALVESDLKNVNYGDRDSLGLFQQRPSMGWGTPQQVTDPTYAATIFYERLFALKNPTWDKRVPGDAAQDVQRSGFPFRYQPRIAEATDLHAKIVGRATVIDNCNSVAVAASGNQTKVTTYTTAQKTITVDTSIAPNLQRLLDAANRDGIKLGGWGYRSNARQISLRKKHCGTSQYAIYKMSSSSCSPPTATPGRSQHEKGLAVDFTCNGGSIRRSSKCYKWLAANAHRYGLKNLPSEAWHWSTTGK